MQKERRQHVRVRPAADYDLGVELEPQGRFKRMVVVDVGVGGLGLYLNESLVEVKVGQTLALIVTFPREGALPFRMQVRHITGGERGVCGMQIMEASDEGLAAFRRYVGEMLDRGLRV